MQEYVRGTRPTSGLGEIIPFPRATEVDFVADMRAAQAAVAEARNAAEVAEHRFIADVAARWREGKLDPEELIAEYDVLRREGMSGFGARWLTAMPTMSPGRMRSLVDQRFKPNGPNGSWHGAFRLPAEAPRPPRDQPVLYFLIDDKGAVAYVGSTCRFTIRLSEHRQMGKPVATWIAQPHATRDAAYEAEQAYLDRHKPYLNHQANACGPRDVRERWIGLRPPTT